MASRNVVSGHLGLSSDQVRWGGLLLIGLFVGLMAPRLFKFGRRAVPGVGGMTYRTEPPSRLPTAADPAGGRPA